MIAFQISEAGSVHRLDSTRRRDIDVMLVSLIALGIFGARARYNSRQSV